MIGILAYRFVVPDVPGLHAPPALLFDSAFLSQYHISVLEAATVALYFLVMAVLCAYGLHRYQLIYLYYRHRRNAVGAPAERFTELPRVTVQLPIYNERFVVDTLLESVCRMDYPLDLLDIQVLDDSTDETRDVAQSAVERLKSLGYPIEYLHRKTREGFKAGALQAGLETARGEFIAIFDADFTPLPDFLQRTIHYFTDAHIGAIQTRWGHRNRDESLLTQVQAILLDGHFVFEHGGRSRSGRFFNFNGTAGVLRRAMIEDAGGWQSDTLTEDTDLSYRAQIKGWQYLYLPDVEVPAELPSDMLSFQVQQARWAKGLIQTAKKILPRLLLAPLPLKVKAEAWFHLTTNLSYPLMAVLAPLLIPAMTVRYFWGDGDLLALDLFLFLGTFSSFSSFYMLAQKELFPRSWRQKFILLPMVLAMGVGLMINNCIAVLEALFGIQSPFERTAKYSSDHQRAVAAKRKYRRTNRWLPVANLAAGTYFLLCIFYSLHLDNWWALPFLLVFMLGYYFTAFAMFQHARITGAGFEGPHFTDKAARSAASSS